MRASDYRSGAGRVYAFFKGRHTTFAVFFTLAGTALAFLGKLSAEYVALIGAIQTLIAFHSWKEGKEESAKRGPDAQ